VIGSIIAIGLAVMSPLQNDWKGWGHYLFSLLVMPLPFIVLTVIGIIGFRRAGKNAN
jgi:phosphate/sulfate permease